MYFGGTGVEVIIIKRVIRDELFGDVENLGAFPVRAQTKLVLAYLADGFDRQVLFSFIRIGMNSSAGWLYFSNPLPMVAR